MKTVKEELDDRKKKGKPLGSYKLPADAFAYDWEIIKNRKKKTKRNRWYKVEFWTSLPVEALKEFDEIVEKYDGYVDGLLIKKSKRKKKL